MLVSIPKHLWIAIQEIGQSEISGDESNPRIDAYLKTVDMPGNDEIPWCAAFMNWVVNQVNIPGTGEALARSFLTWGAPMPMPPEIGAVTVIQRGSEPWMGHVGLFMGMSNPPGYIFLLGGNQGNQVSVKSYPVSKVLAYRWHPDFGEYNA